MPHYHKLNGQKCYLSPVQPADADLFAAWLNDLEVTLPLGDEAYDVIGLERMQEDVSNAIQHKAHVFSIVESSTNQTVGRCLLFNVDMVNRSAETGIFIGDKDWWNQGIGTEAMCLLLDFAFNLLNLHSVMLGTYSFNERSVHVYEKVGFRIIGERRDVRCIRGNYYHLILMDILEDEFRSHWKSIVRI